MGEPAEVQARLKYAEFLLKKGMREEAREELAALACDGSPGALYRLAVVSGEEGRHGEAVEHLVQALRADPGDVRALNALGVALDGLKRPEEAVAAYREALRVDPRFEQARVNLALLLQGAGGLSEAERLLAEGVELAPSARLLYNLGNVLQGQGRSLDAVDAYRRVLGLDPEHLDARQNLLFALHYSERFSDREIFAEHLRGARRRLFRPAFPPPRPPRTEGRVRIGYVSPDFRCHSVASFIEPVLENHDRERFEIYCYANVARPDSTTERLKRLELTWRDIHGVPDRLAAAMIEADGIDILVDLAGHTSGNRLPLFALRPAPLQVTWLGYPDTTGIAAIDYRITDRLADPPGRERFHSEKLVRLPRTFCCYLPPPDAPEVTSPPSSRGTPITFGSFNNLAKVTPEVIALWSRVLLAVPGSRFLLKGGGFADAGVRERYLGMFERCGIDRARVHLVEATPTTSEHLAQYGLVDIALDTFPYNGTTTTCEALWMGVPVVTLTGTRHASRTGASLLCSCGMADLAAPDPVRYLEIARSLAGDTARLVQFRVEARQRLASSHLLDAAGITRELEWALERL